MQANDYKRPNVTLLLLIVAFVLLSLCVALTGHVSIWSALPFVLFAVLSFITHRGAMKRERADE